MKSIFFKSRATLISIVLFVQIVSGQRTNTKKVQPANPQSTIVTPATGFGGVPFIIDSSAITDTIRKSIRPPGTFGAKPSGNRTPLPYEHLRYDDALYIQKVWRELDLREKMNQPFRYDASNDEGSQLFINMLLKAVQSGQVAAFEDDRFSIPVSPTQIADQVMGKLDTIPRYDFNGVLDAYIITRAKFDPKTVTKIRIVEEWIFDSKGSRVHCRIIGLAPLKKHYFPDGKERSSSVLFWIHYPDLRPILAGAEVYNPKNMGQNRMTWDELFESRMFSSYIIKSTLDNAANRPIQSYIKDPVLALLESDNVKNKIFNYEQDLWSY